MKTFQCGDNELHPSHSYKLDLPKGYGVIEGAPESEHNRFCNGIQPADHRSSASHANEHLHRILHRPYKLSMALHILDSTQRVDYLVRNLRKQLRTRDRKITLLIKENRALRAELDNKYLPTTASDGGQA